MILIVILTLIAYISTDVKCAIRIVRSIITQGCPRPQNTTLWNTTKSTGSIDHCSKVIVQSEITITTYYQKDRVSTIVLERKRERETEIPTYLFDM